MSPIPPAIAKAWAKAEEGEYFRNVQTDVGSQGWKVPSRTTGEFYRLFIPLGGFTARGRKFTDATPWFEQLSCECPAEAAGYVVCYHKAAVALAVIHQLVPSFGLHTR